MSRTVLVVDDDPTQRRLAQAVLEREGYAVVHAESGGEAIDRLTRGGGADVVLLDMIMPGMSGMEALAEIRTAGVTTPVIVLTASGGVDAVVKAMQAGAQDFFVKPVSAERLLVGVRNALQLTQLTAEVGRLKKHVTGRTSFDDLVGQSAPMRMVRSLGLRAAKSGIPVLITGESGVGKEVIARALHGASDRGGKPFVAVNCGALPVNLVESILFGHEKGSFTGASDKHLGKFAEASGGTLFLDEIGELPLELQAKLLRVLENGEYQRVGETQPRFSNARVVTATNRDLRAEIKAGRFRADLYHRLSVFSIAVPPLRDMGQDKLTLLDYFRDFYAREAKTPPFHLDPRAQQMWEDYHFPGNVRELRNIAIRLTTKYPGMAVNAQQLEAELDTDQAFPQEIPLANDSKALIELARKQLQTLANFNLDVTLRQWEKAYVEAALNMTHGNLSQAAKLLGINRTTLYSRMQTYGSE